MERSTLWSRRTAVTQRMRRMRTLSRYTALGQFKYFMSCAWFTDFHHLFSGVALRAGCHGYRFPTTRPNLWWWRAINWAGVCLGNCLFVCYSVYGCLVCTNYVWIIPYFLGQRSIFLHVCTMLNKPCTMFFAGHKRRSPESVTVKRRTVTVFSYFEERGFP